MFSATTEWGGRILAEKVFREQNLEKVKVFVCGGEGRLRSAAEFLSQAAGCEIWTGLLCADSTQPLGPSCVPGFQDTQGVCPHLGDPVVVGQEHGQVL